MARTNRRSKTNSIAVIVPYNAMGWRVVKRIPMEAAADMILAGVAQPRYDGVTKELKGIEIGQAPASDHDLPFLNVSPCALTASEMQTNAGLMGESSTAGLAEAQRLNRIHPKSNRILPAEDAVERVREKVRLYTECITVGGDRAVRVYPRGVR